MPWYRCYVQGENFLRATAETGRIERFGFYTTRWVEAGSPEEAETKALALMRSEDTFAPPLGHAPPKDAKVYFEKIIEVDGPRKQGGATWFPMEEDGEV
jgi:hypothetical protein